MIGTAAIALLAGTSVYLLDRDWTSALFLSPVAALQPERLHVFGALGGALPSLLHAYALAVLLMAVLQPWPRTRPWICIGWFSVAGSLECMQATGVGRFLLERQEALSGVPVLNNLALYAAHGQFDVADIWATAIGCLTAYVTSAILWRPR